MLPAYCGLNDREHNCDIHVPEVILLSILDLFQALCHETQRDVLDLDEIKSIYHILS